MILFCYLLTDFCKYTTVSEFFFKKTLALKDVIEVSSVYVIFEHNMSITTHDLLRNCRCHCLFLCMKNSEDIYDEPNVLIKSKCSIVDAR